MFKTYLKHSPIKLIYIFHATEYGAWLVLTLFDHCYLEWLKCPQSSYQPQGCITYCKVLINHQFLKRFQKLLL